MALIKNFSNFIEYPLLRIVEVILNIIPRPIALRLGACAGWLLYVSMIYRKIV
jgi:hypothetical protein